MAQDVRHAAQQVYAALLPSLSRETLTDYGLPGTGEQAEAILAEAAILNRTWAAAALSASLGPHAGPILDALATMIQERLLGQGVPALGAAVDPLDREGYDRMVGQGAAPIDVFTEAAERLESNGVIDRESRHNFLAFCLDLIPVDEFGELAASFDVS